MPNARKNSSSTAGAHLPTVEDQVSHLFTCLGNDVRIADYQTAAKIRSVYLRNLPANTTSYIVSTLVWGGDIEHIEHVDGNSSAKVRFVDAKACQIYFEKTANGINYPPRAGTGKAVWVELATEVEPLSGNLLDAIERREATRCVRAIGVDTEWSIDALTRLAEGAKRDVKVLRVQDEPPNGPRKVSTSSLLLSSRFAPANHVAASIGAVAIQEHKGCGQLHAQPDP